MLYCVSVANVRESYNRLINYCGEDCHLIYKDRTVISLIIIMALGVKSML